MPVVWALVASLLTERAHNLILFLLSAPINRVPSLWQYLYNTAAEWEWSPGRNWCFFVDCQFCLFFCFINSVSCVLSCLLGDFPILAWVVSMLRFNIFCTVWNCHPFCLLEPCAVLILCCQCYLQFIKRCRSSENDKIWIFWLVIIASDGKINLCSIVNPALKYAFSTYLANSKLTILDKALAAACSQQPSAGLFDRKFFRRAVLTVL